MLPAYLGGPNVITRVGSYKWKRESGESGSEGNVMTEEAESKRCDRRKTQVAIAALKVEGGHEPRNEASL